jgi:hypothetical protein
LLASDEHAVSLGMCPFEWSCWAGLLPLHHSVLTCATFPSCDCRVDLAIPLHCTEMPIHGVTSLDWRVGWTAISSRLTTPVFIPATQPLTSLHSGGAAKEAVRSSFVCKESPGQTLSHANTDSAVLESSHCSNAPFSTDTNTNIRHTHCMRHCCMQSRDT